MDKQQQMQDILEDTIEYYGDDPSETRAADDGECVYTDADGRHCAVGRYLKPEFQTTGFYANSGQSVNCLAADVDTYLDSKVIGLTEKFWSALQDIHDSDNNWGEYDEGLTECGKTRCGSMKDRIEAGDYS